MNALRRFSSPDPAPAPLTRPWRRGAAGLWGIAILSVIFLSVHPWIGPPGGAHADKLSHFLAYWVLASLPFFVFSRHRAALAGALAMIILGLTLEGIQSLLPTRHGSLLDALANSLGVMAGILSGPWMARLAGWCLDHAARAMNPGRRPRAPGATKN